MDFVYFHSIKDEIHQESKYTIINWVVVDMEGENTIWGLTQQ